MDLSIIICTYNRFESLRNTFDSMLKLELPLDSSFEILIVDNNSSDSTRGVVSQFKSSAPFSVRYVFEERQGLSHARNRGVREAKGEILAFTDDDVLVDKYWLINILKTFNVSELACAGGRIFPIWEKERPKWLTSELYNFLALLDLGDTPKQLTEDTIYGANFVVRATMFQKYGKFDISVGRTAGKLYAGEESDFIERLLAGGEKVFYIPELLVHHYIPAKRMEKSYFRKWIRDNSELTANKLEKYTQRNIVGVPFYIIKSFIMAVIDYLVSSIIMKENFRNELLVLKYAVIIATRLKNKSSYC